MTGPGCATMPWRASRSARRRNHAPYLDTTGAASLERVCGDLEAEGIAVAVAAAKSRVRTMLDRTALAARIGPERMLPTVESVVEALTRATP